MGSSRGPFLDIFGYSPPIPKDDLAFRGARKILDTPSKIGGWYPKLSRNHKGVNNPNVKEF